jgi:streptogramin lyase
LGAGSVWVENYGDSSLTRVNAKTGAVQRTITTGNQPYDVAFVDGAAWVTDYLDGTVSRIDANTDKRTVVQTGGQPIGSAPSHGSLWVALGTADEVVQIDAATSRVVKRLTVPGRPTWTAFTDNSVWISQSATGDVTRIDTADATITTTIHLGKGQVPQDGAVVAGAVWVPCLDGSLFRIDAGTDTVTGPWPTNDGNPFVVDGHSSTLWAPDYRGSTVAEIDITKLP